MSKYKSVDDIKRELITLTQGRKPEEKLRLLFSLANAADKSPLEMVLIYEELQLANLEYWAFATDTDLLVRASVMAGPGGDRKQLLGFYLHCVASHKQARRVLLCLLSSSQPASASQAGKSEELEMFEVPQFGGSRRVPAIS